MGEAIEVEVTLETMPSVLLDAVAVPEGDAAAKTLGSLGHVAECIVNACRHCKPPGTFPNGGEIING
ncbi:MAG: hypothetical protein ACREXK_10355 [Gammaproteobacteria bacterium]